MPRLKPPPGRSATARVAEVPEDETTNVLATPQDNPPEEEIVIEDNPPPEDEASLAFKQQIEALKESERLAKEARDQAIKDREVAIQQAREREAEASSLRKTTIESQLENVSSALAAAQIEADAAMRDIALAGEASDFQALSQAHRKLAKAEAAIARLEDGKAELEERAKAPPPQQAVGDHIDRMDIPDNAKAFLRRNRHYLEDKRLNAKLNVVHLDLLDEGYAAFSDDYMAELQTRMQPKRKETPAAPEPEDNVQPQRRASEVVSAPVSREAPSSSGTERPGRITLTVAQKEAAKMAGITEAEYAKQLLRLRQEKALGNYTGG